jgi:DNA-binding beta-propeller fold protein YncE
MQANREVRLIKCAPIMVVIASLVALSQHSLPGGSQGIGFDDLGFAKTVRKVMVPGGNTGTLGLIDPDSQRMEIIVEFGEHAAYSGGHGEGITSADASDTVMYVTDRSARMLDIVDLQTHGIIARAPLASEPDYVRAVPETNEVWVTEPGSDRIEIFSLTGNRPIAPTHLGFISVPGGPESLVVGHECAFTNLWRSTTVAIDPRSRKIVGRWLNGCKGSRGIALDEERGFVFVGCDEGKLSVLDINNGRLLGEVSAGAGIDIIAYNQKLAHVYLPSADTGSMAVIGISGSGAPTLLRRTATVKGAHCVTADDRDHIYVCDPMHGKILVLKDTLPSTE